MSVQGGEVRTVGGKLSAWVLPGVLAMLCLAPRLEAGDLLTGFLLQPWMLAEPLAAETEESGKTASSGGEAGGASAKDAPANEPAANDGSANEAPAGGGSANDAEEKDAEEKAPFFQMSITASAWFGSLSGSLQTSKGGGAGTTSWDRPTLEEIGLDGLQVLPVVDARMLFVGDHELHVHYDGVDISGSDVLTEDLVSQDVAFAAGSYVESGLELDIIRFGYRLHWLGLEWLGWSLEPEIGYSISPFRYTLSSPTVAGDVDRSYSIAFPYMSLLFEGPVVGALRCEVEVAGSAGFNGANLLDVDVRLAYQLAEYEGISASAVVGLKGTWLRRRDFQSPQYNDIDLRIGSFSTMPWAGLTAGLRIGF